MEVWFLILVSLCIAALLKSILNLFFPSKLKARLPPGPLRVPVIGSFVFLGKSFSELDPILRNLHAKYGPVVTLYFGSRPAVFIADRILAHRALVQNGTVFSNRPPALETSKVMTTNQSSINSQPYGPKWRLFRRNLTSEILHPARVKSYAPARKWVLEILMNRLESSSGNDSGVTIVNEFQYAMFCLLVYICFGDKVDEKQIKEVERVQRDLLLKFGRFNMLSFWGRIGKLIFRKRWEELYSLRKNQNEVLIQLIRARKERKQEKGGEGKSILSYVDTLLELELPEEKRKLSEEEIVSMCSEFLNAGTDTTATALQWIMANLVKHPHIQDKLVEEIEGTMAEIKGDEAKDCDEVTEEDLSKMKYLEAVVLEGLRRHPPGHFVLPHSVTEDVKLEGHYVPKIGTVNFMVAEMGLDPKVWEDPLEFKPERFLNGEVFDITCSREIKMMPFGAGRRICPGYVLALLHLQYFVANLVWQFRWTAVDGDDVDLSEKVEFTVVMKNPLKARVSRRSS